MSQPINIFIAYAREDKLYLEELRRQMKILERRADVRIWYDGEIIAGQKWNEVIEAELEKADLFLMLLSADFINSEYTYTKEMTQALARHERGEAILIPIVVRSCAWHYTPLAHLQAPVEGKPLASEVEGKRDELYTEIVNAIVKTIEERKKQKDNEARYFADEAAWKEALKLNSNFGFNRYLAQYPQGKYAADAKNGIADIEREEQAEKENIERKTWQQALKITVSSPKVNRRLFLSLMGIAFVGIFIFIWQYNSFTTTVIEPEMIFVQGDTFTMGCKHGRDSDCDDDEKPAHQVTLNDFYMGKYEVTVKEYLAFADATKSNYPEWLETGNDYHVETGSDTYYKGRGYSRNAENLPIVGVSWDNAVAYCKWLSEKTGKTYRLPIEAEWEYAARGGQITRNYLYAGSNNLDEVAWYYVNSGGSTHAVGTKKANELGIFDMSGNVWEWCSDWYDEKYYKSSSAQNPKGTSSGEYRVLRGGPWNVDTSYCRVSSRSGFDPIVRNVIYGFRVSRS